MLLCWLTGRQVAVDWAVPKDRYLATQQPSSAGNFNINRDDKPIFCFLTVVENKSAKTNAVVIHTVVFAK